VYIRICMDLKGTVVAPSVVLSMYKIRMCKTDIKRETGRYDTGCRSTTSDGTTNMKRCMGAEEVDEGEDVHAAGKKEGILATSKNSMEDGVTEEALMACGRIYLKNPKQVSISFGSRDHF